MKRKDYEKQLRKLQVELCAVQDWVKHAGLRVVVVFEGRDAAGKGGTIKAITERVSPRVFRVVALPAPSDREKGQLYLQRYVAHLPTAGEIVMSPTDLCSRSKWFEYSRARDAMFAATNTNFAPWYIVRSDDKRRGRLNCIRHLLSLITYEKVPQKKAKLPDRIMDDAYDDLASLKDVQFVAESW